MKNLLDFSQQIIVINGATSELGKALATALSDRGAKLLLCGNNESELESLATNVSGPAAALVCETWDDAHGEAMIDAALEIFEDISMAINISSPEAGQAFLMELNADEAGQALTSGLEPFLIPMQYQIDHFQRRGGGAILNLAFGGALGLGGWQDFGALPHLMSGLIREAAMQCQAENIRVNGAIINSSAIVENDAANDAGLVIQKDHLEQLVDAILLMSTPANRLLQGQMLRLG